MKTKPFAAALLLLAVLCSSSAHAQSGSSKTTSALNTEVNSFWPDNNNGAITPYNARQTLLDLIASYPNLNVPISLAQGGLGCDQSSATSNSIPVFPGAGGCASPTSLSSIFASPNPIGNAAPNTGAFTNLSASGRAQYTGGPSFNVYVATTGSDSNSCLSTGQACLTIAHAIAVGQQYDARGGELVVNIGTGTFNGPLLVVGPARGSSAINGASEAGIWIVGNGSANTIIDDSSGSTCNTLTTSGSGTQVVLRALTIQQTNSSCTGGSAIFVQDLSFVNLGSDIVFGNVGTSGGSHIHAEGNSVVEVTTNYTIAGNASYHWNVSHGANILIDGYTITCSGSPAFTDFAFAQEGGKIIPLTGTAFSGCGTATGGRFAVLSNGIIDTFTQNASFFPGNSAGTRDSGGKYLPLGSPTIGTCTNGSVTSNGSDFGFQVGFTGSNSSCSITFAVPKARNAVCVAVSNGATVNMGSLSASGMSFTGTFTSSNVIDVVCPDS